MCATPAPGNCVAGLIQVQERQNISRFHPFSPISSRNSINTPGVSCHITLPSFFSVDEELVA